MESMYMQVGISLGWNCDSASWGVQNRIRASKGEGYKTCPFDMCVSNLQGILLCIQENFAHFTDDKYLEVIKAPFATGGIVEGECLLYNTRYNLIFNHESPGHANLWKIQNWPGGINHFTDNNFAEFKKRYDARIQNFRAYTSDPTIHVTFITTYFNIDILEKTIKTAYPTLTFDIIRRDPRNEKEMQEHIKLMMRY